MYIVERDTPDIQYGEFQEQDGYFKKKKQKIKLRINFLFVLIAGYPIHAEQN